MENTSSTPVIIDMADAEKADAPDLNYQDPTKLSWPRKLLVVVAGFTATFNCNLASSLPSGGLVSISEHFSVSERPLLVLLNSLYMVGYVLGPLLWGPLSEYKGRRPVLLSTFAGYLIFLLASSIAPDYASLLIFRTLGGICASAPTAVIGGLYADVLDNPTHRGIAMSFYLSITTAGPLVGPVISGYASQISWSWPFWIAAFIASPGIPLVLALPETYVPVLKQKAMVRWLQENGAHRKEIENVSSTGLDPRKIFLRPAVLMATEPVLLFMALYLALTYAIMFLTFQAYPIIFQEHYGLSPARAGLAYIPIIIGVLSAFVAGTFYGWYFDNAAANGAPWAQKEVYRRLPIACVGSPFMVIGLFWLGWTSYPDSIPAITPMMSGIAFGFGMQLIYIGGLNFITDAFKTLSASAHSAAGITRSISAVLLPLATSAMYSNLGVQWAPSLLAFLSLAMGLVPFVFIYFGDSFKARTVPV